MSINYVNFESIVLVSLINFFCVILIDRASLVSARRSCALESMVMDPKPVVWNIFFFSSEIPWHM